MSVVVGPYPKYLDGVLFWHDLVDEPMLDVYIYPELPLNP